MSNYTDGYNRVMKTAGLEKTALNERLLRRLLNAEFGEHSWDTRGILKALRTGEEFPMPSSINANEASRVETQYLRNQVDSWKEKFSPTPRGRSLLRKRVDRLSPDEIMDRVNEDPKAWRDVDPDNFLAGREMTPEAEAFVMRQMDQGGRADDMFVKVREGQLSDVHDRLGRTERRRAAQTLGSGRHRDDAFIDASNIKTVNPDTGDVLGGKGYHPDRIAYRGDSSSTTRVVGEKDPRWVSGHPDISLGYAGHMSAYKGDGRTLTAYDLSRIPQKHQGPWAPHLAQDSRQFSMEEVANTPHIQGFDSSAWGQSPTYEKVVTQKALHPAESHRYKILPDDRLMRVKGDAATDPLRK